jgi:hypothetical protein
LIITLLRKPVEGTVAENTLKHGCGSINIDATRVSFDGNESINFEARQRQQADPREKGWSGHVAQVGSDIQMYKEKGRWPANFILTHKDSCELKGMKKIKGHKGYPNEPGGIWSKEYQENLQKDRSLTDVKTVKDNEAWVGHADKDGEEAVADWACVEGCPVRELDRQSGHQKSGIAGSKSRAWGVAGKGQLSSTENGVGWKAYGSEGYGDEGGASRFFKQFKETK